MTSTPQRAGSAGVHSKPWSPATGRSCSLAHTNATPVPGRRTPWRVRTHVPAQGSWSGSRRHMWPGAQVRATSRGRGTVSRGQEGLTQV